MKIIEIKKGDELSASQMLSNRTDSDFEEIDRTVREVIEDVRVRGDEALYHYMHKFGGPSKEQMGDLRVTDAEVQQAYEECEPRVIEAFEKAAENIREFHSHQLVSTWSYKKGKDIVLGQLIRPIKNVGVYIPGGTAPLSSTVLMNVIPAKIAGCGEIVITTLVKEGAPLIRYRTKDICVLSRKKCSCGRTFIKMAKPMGRSDDMLIIKGVNVFPSQIETVLLNKGYQANYLITVDRVNNSDTLDIDVEMTPEMFSDNLSVISKREKELVDALKAMLGIYARVHLVSPKTITRSEGKAVRVIDKRKLV